MNLREQLVSLQQVVQTLEYDANQRMQQLQEVVDYCEDFTAKIDTQPVYSLYEEERDSSDKMRLTEDPLELKEIIQLLKDHVDPGGVQIGSKRFFGFIPSGGLYSSALGDYIAAVTNRYAGVQFSGPGATWLERKLVQWFAELVGYPKEAEGDLTSGGSIATLSSIIAAREAFNIKSRNIERIVVYLTSLTHHSVQKALRIAGLSECILRYVPIDQCFRMDVDALEQAVISDINAGKLPWLVVATAGTTDMGSVDPLESIAQVVEAHQLWLHVDAAYGGAFVLCDEGKARLKGLERSDSMILDPHKGLFLPFGSGIVLTRNGESLRRAYFMDAAYLQDLREGAHPTIESAADISPELSRPFRGLRLWLPIKLAGLAPYRAAVKEKLLLAQYFYEQLSEIDGFDLGLYPDLSIIIFRYLPPRGDANEFNKQLLEEIRRDGRIFLSSTTIQEKYLLRFAVLSYNTHIDDVDMAIELIQQKVRQILDASKKYFNGKRYNNKAN